MPEYLSKEEIRKWRSSLERITLEEYAARLGKIVQSEKHDDSLVDSVMLKSLNSMSTDTYEVRTEKINSLAIKSFQKEKEITKKEIKVENKKEIKAKEPVVKAVPKKKEAPKAVKEVKTSKTEEVNFSFKKLTGLLKLKKQMKKLNKLMQTKYKGYDCYGHIGVAKGEYFGISKGVDGYCGATKEDSFPNYIKGSNPNLKDLALPFSEFCKLNGVEEVQRIWIAPFTSFGYGFFDEIPAALVMKYLDVTTALEFVNMKLWTWQDGTQQIYVHVNEKLLHPAHLEMEVVKVERPEGKVLVTTKDKNGKQKTEEFDKLIVTTPLDRFINYADATEEEKELFSKIVHERYCDYIATFEEGKSPNISGYLVENMVPERLGHAMVYYNRWQYLDRDCPATVYALANHTGSPAVDYDTVMKTMDEDMTKVGFPIKEKLFAQEVYYCPHVSCEDYAAGWYDRLEALQGNKNTFYAGEIISFGDMEDTCAASKDIIGRFF